MVIKKKKSTLLIHHSYCLASPLTQLYNTYRMKNIVAEVTNKKTLIGKIMSMFLATMTHNMVHFRSCYKTEVKKRKKKVYLISTQRISTYDICSMKISLYNQAKIAIGFCIGSIRVPNLLTTRDYTY